MSEHTPGPWNVTSNAGEIKAAGRTLCDVYGDDEQADIDAHLIAAAPDLLAALEAVMATRTTPWRKDAMKANQLAIAAIAKAKGDHP